MDKKEFKKILKIDAKGLTYLDQDNKEAYIDFANCHHNYVTLRTDPAHLRELKIKNNLTDEDLSHIVDVIRTSKQVALRFGNFIEFHTEPPVRFELEDRKQYVALLFAIAEAGWTTFDLT